MKKAFYFLVFVAITVSEHAQSSAGTLLFKTLGIQKADGSGTYNVPIFASNGDNLQGWVWNANDNSTTGAGLLAGGATIGLFTPGSATPFFTSKLGTTVAQSPYAVNPASATVEVPGTTPGMVTSLMIRVWMGSDFAEAQRSYFGQWREWAYTTKPLGGTPIGGGLPITPPTLTGWGPENGAGYELNMLIPEPTTIALGILGVGALVLARRRK